MSDSPKILVTGASGTNGRELVKRLSSARVAVRGMIHNRQGRADAPLPDVEFVIADFDDSVGRCRGGRVPAGLTW